MNYFEYFSTLSENHTSTYLQKSHNINITTIIKRKDFQETNQLSSPVHHVKTSSPHGQHLCAPPLLLQGCTAVQPRATWGPHSQDPERSRKYLPVAVGNGKRANVHKV